MPGVEGNNDKTLKYTKMDTGVRVSVIPEHQRLTQEKIMEWRKD